MPEEDLTVRTCLRARKHCAVSAGDDVGDCAAVGWREKPLLVGQQVMQDDVLSRRVAEGVLGDAGSLRIWPAKRRQLQNTEMFSSCY